MKKFLFLSLLFYALQAYSISFDRSYRGRINNYPVSVFISCDDNNVVGYYYYDRFKEKIPVKGIVSGKTIDLTAYDNQGKVRERFSGVLATTDITGVWTDLRSQIKYPFRVVKANHTDEVLAYADDHLFYLGVITLVLVLFVCYKWFKNFLADRRIKKSINVAISEIRNEDEERRRDDFEKYIVSLFNQENYELLDWRSEIYKYGKILQSNKLPDLLLKKNEGRGKFSIECKFRPAATTDTIEIGPNGKVKEYRDYSYSKNIPVYVAIGLGGLPSKPEELYMVPITAFKSETISLSEIKKFRITGETLSYNSGGLNLSDNSYRISA